MINLKKRFGIIFSVLVIIALIIPISVSANEQEIYPNSINGYPVIFKATSENTFGLNPGDTVLTIFIDDLVLEDKFIAEKRVSIYEYLDKNPLPKNTKILIYGGPGASKDLYLQNHQKYYERFKKDGLPHWMNNVSNSLNTESLSSTTRSNPYTFAIVQNMDPDYETITFQSVYWYSPTVGTDQDNWCAMLLNGKTNSVSDYYFQVGQAYDNDGGYNVYTDTTLSLTKQVFSGVRYYPGDNCKFAMGKLTNGWFVSCTNYTSQEYEEYDESSAPGTNLVTHVWTDVFLENWNTNSDWYDSFSQYGSSSGFFTVRNARDVQSGTFSNWSHQQRVAIDADYYAYYDPYQTIMSGSLVNNGNAYWDLSEVFLAQ